MKYKFSKKCKECGEKIHANNKELLCEDCKNAVFYKTRLMPHFKTDEEYMKDIAQSAARRTI